MEFYGAAAQIIPVLLLSLIFENRMLVRQPSSYADDAQDPSHWNATQIVGRVYLTLLIIVAEGAALVKVYRQEEDPLSNGLVWIGLGAVLTALLTSVLKHQWDYWREWWSTRARADLWLPAFVLISLVVLTAMVLDWIT